MELIMRAEHRHELKTNELAEWIGSLPEWAKQHQRTIFYVSLVVVVGAAYYFYYQYQNKVVAKREQGALTNLIAQIPMQKEQIARVQSAGQDRSFELLQMASALENIANESKQDTIAALAFIKEAEILRSELHLRFGVINPQDFANQTNRAKEIYQKVLDTYLKRTPDASLEAMAKLGLGLCDEDVGNLEQARKIYEEVATGPAYEGTTAAAAAKQRLQKMDFFTRKLVLKNEPAPARSNAQLFQQEANQPAQVGAAVEANAQGLNALP